MTKAVLQKCLRCPALFKSHAGKKYCVPCAEDVRKEATREAGKQR